MKLQKFSLLLTLMLCFGLVVPLFASAASATVTVNAMQSTHPGESVTISGTSTLAEVIIKVLRPNTSNVFFDIVKVTNGTFTSTFTLGSSEAAGTYKVVAGQGSEVAGQDLVVTAIVTPLPTLSSNADLSGLTLSSGALKTAFVPGTTDYSSDVANNVSSLTVTASVSDIKATMTVNGTPVTSGQPSSEITLIVGSNVISIEVTAENGTSKKPYTVNVNRAAEISGNADLSVLALSSGSLSPAFVAGTTAYTSSVANSVSSLMVTASVSDGKATMTVNGSVVISGQASSVINLNVGSNPITIVVTAQNGATKTYTVTVTRGTPGGGITIPTNNTVTSTDGNLTLPAGKTGEVSLNKELTISIPSGASDKELKLTIEKVLDTQKLLTHNEVLVSPVYEILKNFSENFSKPVTLKLAFNPAGVKSDQKVSVFYYDEATKVWVEVGGVVNGDQISVDVNHFTKFAVLVVDKAPAVPVQFSDITGHWSESNIKQAVSAGIVSGYPDGTFKPDRTVTRAEFAVMLMNSLKPKGDGIALTFADKAVIGAWAQKAVAQAVQAGIISGYEDGTFRPDAEITRAEMAVMIARAGGKTIDANVVTTFADDMEIPEWAKASVAYVKQAGMVQGRDQNQFAPLSQATRAEAVTVLLKLSALQSK